MKGIHNMMILIIGGSGSGKSSYGEDMISFLSKGRDIKKYYLATMEILDKEGRKKVERHRRLRREKGFFTIEQSRDIHKALNKMDPGEKAVLLECISNLVANEIFSEKNPKSEKQIEEKIIREIKIIKERITDFVVVSNNIFEDGIVYNEETMQYIYTMGRMNQELAAIADQVVEVVVGIPLVVKQQVNF